MDNFIKIENNLGNGDEASNFINLLEDVTGWVANRTKPNKIAIDTYIKGIQESDMDSLTKAALISNARKIIKEYSNQVDILNIAIQNLTNTTKLEGLEEDWLVQFMDKARLVSSNEFQIIWGKVLAYECNNPESIPKSLLSTLSKMDRKDAEAFTALASISVKVDDEFSPVIDQYNLDEYQQWGINLDNLMDIKSLGLIEMSAGESKGYAIGNGIEPARVEYFDFEYQFIHSKTVRIGNVVFTKSGAALQKLVQANKADGFWEKCCLPLFESCEKKE